MDSFLNLKKRRRDLEETAPRKLLHQQIKGTFFSLP